MDKETIINTLEEIGTLLELKGENPFKARAYHNAARALETTSEEIDKVIQENKLREIPGIGEHIAQKIEELHKEGHLPYYEELKESIPLGLFEMIQVPGLGPKKAKHFYDELGIKNLGELEYACQENRLLKLKGFGEKSQAKILRAIQFYRKNQNRFLYPDALKEAQRILDFLKEDKNIVQISIAGSLRRRKETIGDIDLVGSAKNQKEVMKRFASVKGAREVIAQGNTKTSLLLDSGIQVDLRLVSKEQYPFALHHFTGSKEHNIALRGLAQSKGLKMNEYGLFHKTGKEIEELIPCKTEAEIFKKLGLNFIEPEMREDQGEIQAASKKTLPNLITLQDIQGTFHLHTIYSDGISTVKAMATEAQKKGLHYIGISDHSQSAYYAHGMKPDDVKRQHKEIDELNKTYKNFHIFKGVESDILADGSLDYDEALLEEFDFVIASVHSRFQMSEEEMTKRIIKALKNPYTTMLGHATGRLLLSREPYAVNLKKVIDAAAEYGKIIELNANPYRLDLDWRYLHYAISKGVKFSINPDAHRPEGIGDIDYGIGMARKGWLTKDDVINTLPLPEINALLR